MIKDPRLAQLRPWRCGSCGELHEGLLDLGADRPVHCADELPIEENSALRLTGDFLSRDFCVLGGEDFFVKAMLELELEDCDETFVYGVWSTLSRPNFERYVEGFDGDEQSQDGPWFGWFSTALKGYPDTVNLKCRVHPQDGQARPLIELEPTEHPLSQEQQHGIDLDRLFEIYAINGHPRQVD